MHLEYMSRLEKRGSIVLPYQELKRLPIYDVGEGWREIAVPEDRLNDEYRNASDMPEEATVRHAGYEYDAEYLEKDGKYYIYDFKTRG